MTRKKYYNKGMALIVAINKKHQTGNVGEALKHFRDHYRTTPELFGSYEKAWNCEAMLFARRYYLNEEC